MTWRLRAFLWLWSACWHLGLPAILFYLRRRARADPDYGMHLAERFGRHADPMRGAVWVHAVSLGEVRSAVPLVRALLDRGERVVLTHFTPAGRREAHRTFAPEIAAGTVRAVWVPVETSWAYAGFFRAFAPKYGLVMEIEVWPRMVFAARGAGVPLLMCNAQYPSRSMARDARGWGIRHGIMRGFAGALVKSELQADRFASIGMTNIAVTGELRFDQPVPDALVAAGRAARSALAGDRATVAFASVVEGEDETCIAAIRTLLSRPDRPFVVYVPRRPERFDATADRLRAAGLRVIRRSGALDDAFAVRGAPEADILLGDSLGEMYGYLAMADRVVVGGGFVPAGAHNIVEPLALRRPVIVGPHIHTIEYPATEAIAAGVCLSVTDGDALIRTLADWPGAGADRMDAFWTAHSGATARTVAAIPRLLAAAR